MLGVLSSKVVSSNISNANHSTYSSFLLKSTPTKSINSSKPYEANSFLLLSIATFLGTYPGTGSKGSKTLGSTGVIILLEFYNYLRFNSFLDFNL